MKELSIKDGVIAITEALDEARENFLYVNFNKDIRLGLFFESTVFQLAKSYSREYNGGYWRFYEAENKACFIALDQEDQFFVVNPYNFFDGYLNGYDYGLALSIMATSKLMYDPKFKEHQTRLIQIFHGLWNVLAERPPEIRKALIMFLD